MSEVLALSEAATLDDGSARECQLARAYALRWHAMLARRQLDYRSARRYFGESLAILRQVGDRQSLADSLLQIGNVELLDGDLTAARDRLEVVLTAARETGDQWDLTYALGYLGMVALHEEDYAGARVHLDEALTIAREAENEFFRSYLLNSLGCVAIGEGRFSAARVFFLEARAIAGTFDDKTLTAHVLEGLSALAAADSAPGRAIRLAGAASTLRETLGAPNPPVWERWFESRLRAARTALEPESSDRAWQEGRAMSLDRAIAYASEDNSQVQYRP